MYARPKNFLWGSGLALSLKEGPVKCAKVCLDGKNNFSSRFRIENVHIKVGRWSKKGKIMST